VGELTPGRVPRLVLTVSVEEPPRVDLLDVLGEDGTLADLRRLITWLERCPPVLASLSDGLREALLSIQRGEGYL